MNLLRRLIWNQNRVYMIPTRYGFIAIFLFLLFTITGAHYANNLIFLFAFILVSFLLVAILQTAKNLRGVDVLDVHVPSGFPHTLVSARLRIRNTRAPL